MRIDSSFQPQNLTSTITQTEQTVKVDKVDPKESKQYYSQEEVTKEKLDKVVESLNHFLEPTMTSLHFKLHEELQEYYVELVDSKTQEVIREIPSKKVLDMYMEMTKLIGLFVDKKI
ncbi:flagellar protein FlaG [Massilibacterium senegalense]|uniref:flagellar protein FlaG n=1 Tax=Massilibacterium senegalense TaxID=1632858 RepID=UPI000782422B|nr:flagellar protein FlaG [Massilibacterium senegalense]